MKLDKYKLVKESPQAFHLHDGTEDVHVAKAGLSDSLVQKIRQHFAHGGEVKGYSGASGDPVDQVVTADVDPSTGAPLTPAPEAMAALSNVFSTTNPAQGAFERQAAQNAADVAATPPLLRAPTDAEMTAPADPPQFATGKMPTAADPIRAGYLGALQMQQKAAGMKADADTHLANTVADIQKRNLQEQADLEQERLKARAGFQREADASLQAYKDGTIDPRRVWSNASIPDKIGASIGILLSGIGSGLTHSPNLALETINKTIDRDIDAQRDNLNKQGNLFRMNLERLHDSDAAYALTRLQKLTAVQSQIEQARALAVGPEAQANLMATLGQIQQQRTAIIDQLGQRQAYANFMSGGGMDASNLARLPAEQQAKIMATHVPNATTQRPVIGPNGQPVVNQSTGEPLMTVDNRPRFGTNEKSTEAAQKGFLDNDMIQGRIAALAKFAKDNPNGAILPATRQKGAALANDVRMSWLGTQENLNRLNPQEMEMLNQMIDNPASIWSAVSGKADASISGLKRMADAKRTALDHAYLIPIRNR